MRLWRIVRQRLRSLFQPETVDADLSREFSFHFDQLVEENIAGGMTPIQARDAARRTLGNTALLEEQCRDHRRVGWLHDFGQDLRHGVRVLRRSPGFTLVAIASLAIGIGANTAILGVMESVLLGKLALPDADRLVVIRTFPLDSPQQTNNASVPDFMAWKEQSRSFEAMGASLADRRDFGLEQDGTPPERVTGEGVTPSLFTTLGVQPVLGRTFTEEEDEIEHPAPVIVIGYRLWQRRFGSDPGILEKQVRLNGQNLTVIGVMPPDFRYPNENSQYWIPLAINRYQLRGSARYFIVTARLKRGTTIAQAQADLEPIAAQLAQDLPERHRGWSVRVQTLREYRFGWARQPLVTLEGAVILMMLISCANVATLLLVRGSVRRPELAMRMALGAGRGRILRQLLTESVLLSLLGGTAGLLVAVWGSRSLAAMTPTPAGFAIAPVELNLTMLGIAALSSILAGLVFGAAPALAGCFSARLLRESGTSAGGHGFRSGLAAVQIALALVLLAGSGLLINSFLRLIGAPRNFDPRGILTFEFRVPLQQYVTGLGTYRGLPVSEVNPPSLLMQQVYERLRSLPGAGSVAGISFPPVNSLVLPVMNLLIESGGPARDESNRSEVSAVYFLVTPNFFAAMKTPFVRGRDFDGRDTPASPWVAVINEAAARQFWPGDDPIGKRFTLDAVSGEQPREVVGIVRDVPTRYIQAEAEPVVYVSYLQQARQYRGALGNMFGQMTFLIRTSADPLSLASPAQRAVAEIDPDRPIAEVQSMERYVGGTVRDRGYYALVLGIFAFTATLLAAIGIYGVMAYTVSQRTREIGVRMALGATAWQILGLVGARAVLLIGSGLGLGLVAAAGLTGLISSQLWGVTATDPLTFGGVSILLALIAAAACVIPARRAIRVDPTEALRSE